MPGALPPPISRSIDAPWVKKELDRRPGFQAALARCRQQGAILIAARLDRITRRAHILSQLLEDGVSIRAADMPGANDLMMRIYAAMAQKERDVHGWDRGNQPGVI